MDFIIACILAIAAFIAGLLVGRRNPAVANVAATIGNDVKSAAQNVQKKG